MEISSNSFYAGLSTINSGQQRAERSAGEIASLNGTSQASADPAASLVELSQGKHEVQAGARVVETADDVLGTLIDTRA